jgi:hypothetical protein
MKMTMALCAAALLGAAPVNTAAAMNPARLRRGAAGRDYAAGLPGCH